MPSRDLPDKFLVGLSFASEQLQVVEPIAEAVERRLGRNTVFFYPWFQPALAGADADLKLRDIYRDKCELRVVCVSSQYGRKSWTLHEWNAIRALLLELRAADAAGTTDVILPLRVGDGDVKGIESNTIVPDVRSTAAAEAADLIVRRLQLVTKAKTSARSVYLAQCSADREDPRQPVNRQRLKALIESVGWTVLPEREYGAAEYPVRLQQDLERAAAFVQLLGRYKWKPEDFDRVQDDAAIRQGLPRIIFRSVDIDLAAVEPPAHREYLTRPEVIVSGFDDFLVDLKDRLQRLTQSLDAAARSADNGDQPLVRVVARSSNPDRLWERVFKWIDDEGDILPHLLGPGESLTAKHELEPCQGFLLVCDSMALEEGPGSLRHEMEECRLLQIREKDAAKRPPVALVYWPPPDVSWPKLIRSRPARLHRAAVAANELVPDELAKFFTEVRQLGR